jgi:RND superfamily putative drug exporter
MDYEVFLLRRIQANYLLSGDNTAATAAGLASTGPVITGAALIMAVVFGAFIGTDLVLLKMIGLGLTVTVLVDATLVRTLMVPAAMCLAGRWNWLPGRRRQRAAVIA